MLKFVIPVAALFIASPCSAQQAPKTPSELALSLQQNGAQVTAGISLLAQAAEEYKSQLAAAQAQIADLQKQLADAKAKADQPTAPK